MTEKEVPAGIAEAGGSVPRNEISGGAEGVRIAREWLSRNWGEAKVEPGEAAEPCILPPLQMRLGECGV
jgi:hypothetical protein